MAKRLTKAQRATLQPTPFYSLKVLAMNAQAALDLIEHAGQLGSPLNVVEITRLQRFGGDTPEGGVTERSMHLADLKKAAASERALSA